MALYTVAVHKIGDPNILRMREPTIKEARKVFAKYAKSITNGWVDLIARDSLGRLRYLDHAEKRGE